MNTPSLPWLSLSVLLILLPLCAILYALDAAGAALLTALAGMLGLLAYHLLNLYRLLKWLAAPSLTSLPDSMGAWGSVWTALYHRERQLARSQQHLESALERFQRAADAIPDGIVVLDERERIEWFNPSARQHLHLDPQQDIGQQLNYLIRNPQFVQYLEQDIVGQPVILRPAPPSDLTLSLQMIPFDQTRKLLIVRDITLMERANTTRRDFVANVSHELRTPLTVIGGFLETLADMPEADIRLYQRYQPLMLEQTRRMQRLVADLLALSRLENGGQVRDDAVNVPRLLLMLRTEAEGLSHGRHEIVLQGRSQRWLVGNEDELHSAFGNLVSNAVRYTPDGGTITLSWSEDGDDGVFAVDDNGIGLEPEHIPRVTERFYRVDSGRSRESGGTGLGLSIVKHVLMRHQAHLHISSEPGRGSRFACRFPAQRLRHAQGAAAGESLAAQAPQSSAPNRR